jgi:hypothetical protein
MILSDYRVLNIGCFIKSVNDYKLENVEESKWPEQLYWLD